MKPKHFFVACCVSLASLVVGMVVGTLIERRHLNFWFPEKERKSIQEMTEKAKRMTEELSEIQSEIEKFAKDVRESIIWNEISKKEKKDD